MTANAPQSRPGDAEDAFIASFNMEELSAPDQFFATYFGGGGDESCNGLAAASGGYALAAGVTESGVPSGFASLGTSGGQDGFILSVGLCPGRCPASDRNTAACYRHACRASHTNHPAGIHAAPGDPNTNSEHRPPRGRSAVDANQGINGCWYPRRNTGSNRSNGN